MSSAPSNTEVQTQPESTPEQIDASFRLPLLLIFTSAAAWLFISSIFGLIASIKFHAPALLADNRWLTYGHVQATAFNTLLYGFVVQAATGLMLWMIARLGRTTAVMPGFAVIGSLFWNVGVTFGLIGILNGDGTGYEWFEFPKYAAPLLFVGYAMMGMVGGMTFAERKTKEMYPSQWFLLAALFWFPWIYATAVALIHWYPVRGVMQAVVHQWYAHNLVTMWLGSIGIATALYFIPRISGKPLASRYYALTTFWFLMIFGGMGGMYPGMPVPAWLPSLSTAMAILLVPVALAFAANIHYTLDDDFSSAKSSPTMKFILAGTVAFVLGILMRAVLSIPEISMITEFTYLTQSVTKLFILGFASMMVLGGIYYVAPKVAGRELPWNFAGIHFWLALGGMLLIVLPLGFGGGFQGVKIYSLTNFIDVSNFTLMFFRITLLGDGLIFLGGLFLLANLKWMVFQMLKVTAKDCIANDGKAKRREAVV